MNETWKTDALISHKPAPRPFEVIVEEVRQRIIVEGDKPHVSMRDQLSILEQLAAFELGRFLLVNHGLNGYWTHYAVFLHPRLRESRPEANGQLPELERFLLNEAPTMLATQERFNHFQRVVQHEIDSHGGEQLAMASVPCGMMADLLTLNYTAAQSPYLAGFDLDEESLTLASEFAREKGRTIHVSRQNAWSLTTSKRFDVLLSNGLNIYEPDDARVAQLYAVFGSALKPGGMLVTSFLTPPAEWKLSSIDEKALSRQRVIFSDVLGVGWQCLRSTELSRQQLQQAGFEQIELISDRANMFPTVVARLRSA